MVKYITEDEVERIFTLPKAIELVEAAFRDRAEGNAFDVPGLRTRQPGGHLGVMPSAAPKINLIGFKYNYVRPGGRTTLVMLHNYDKGHLEAMIEAERLGKLRTAATTSLATRLLSRADSQIVACFGTGRHGPIQLEAVCAARNIREVRAYGRNQERLKTFCDTMSKKLGIEVRAVRSPAEAIAGAHIINTVTPSKTPVFDGKLLEPGQHINAIGANSRYRAEIDLEAVRRSDVIVVDSREVAKDLCGDLLPAFEAGRIYWENIADLGDILIGRWKGRTSDQQITLFESQGMSIQDIYAGRYVLDTAREQNIGLDLPIPLQRLKG